MRYCTNCGSPLENGRFCTSCGTDNGEEKNETLNVAKTTAIQKVDIEKFIHWVAIALFAISAIILLNECIKNTKAITVNSILYGGNYVIAIIFCVVGMWSCIPAVISILNAGKSKCGSVIGIAVLMILVMIAVYILNFVVKGTVGPLKMMATTYKIKAASIITLNVIAIVAEIVGISYSKKREV